MTLAITQPPPSASSSPSLAGVLTEPARVDAMFRNTTRGTRKSSASNAMSRPLASCPANDVREVRTIPSPYRCGWAAL
ncbi:hypothetical protein TL5118_02918 [Thalassovita autumnalis]|uniref:Uncharacterized protein n=1 Tax=Thalassovita autumnalis TaxID=2072972 RepID=A0A0P1FU64_9RHOB|nr:hypothetical protein TL5118_02918 [Thalassovita autumnalis]CUH72216.1 hypothetical protein TL5120_02012 [Thalassovita autumnalis]